MDRALASEARDLGSTPSNDTIRRRAGTGAFFLLVTQGFHWTFSRGLPGWIQAENKADPAGNS